MLAPERHDAIIEQLNRDGSVTVNELSEKFGVTKDSIRKDLTQLEKQGLLKKTYGGAVKPRTIATEFHVEDRKGKNAEAKQEIARKAAALVKDGDTVFLDISTSNIELARILGESDKRITLVSNCIDVIRVIPSRSNIKLIALGGEISEHRGGFIGALTNEQLRCYRFDLAFLGVVGVDLEQNRVSTYIPEDGTTKKAALENSRRTYMMLEMRKLMEDGVYWYSSISSFYGAILDREPEDRVKKWFEQYGIEWL